MRAAVIAAGEGSRLAALGVPKPLVEVGGCTLLARTLRSLVEAGAASIGLIVNGRGGAVARHARALRLPVPVEVLVRDTPSSLHSLLAVAPVAGGAPLLVTTVDSVLAPGAVARFARAFRTARGPELLLAHTGLIDDERPLHVAVDATGRVTAIGEAARGSGRVTAGLYGVGPRVLALGEALAAGGVMRLRRLLGACVEAGLDVRGHDVGDVVDVDRPEDIEVARALLAGGGEGRRCA